MDKKCRECDGLGYVMFSCESKFSGTYNFKDVCRMCKGSGINKVYSTPVLIKIYDPYDSHKVVLDIENGVDDLEIKNIVDDYVEKHYPDNNNYQYLEIDDVVNIYK